MALSNTQRQKKYRDQQKSLNKFLLKETYKISNDLQNVIKQLDFLIEKHKGEQSVRKKK